MAMVLKCFKGFTLTVIVVIYCAKVSFSLRLVRVLIPPYAVRGHTAELMCEFDSERSPLYSVKWFKDDEEFFRYVPAERQQYQVFTSAGLRVDEASSRASRVVLRDLDFAASGNYRCEVSTEGPQFSTVIGQGSLQVVEPLSSDPNLTGGKRKYDVNDTVDLMCTSSPSRPAAHLTWVINGRSPPKEQVMDVGLHQQPDGLLVRSSRISFKTTPSHFVSGRLVIKCVASLSKPLNIIKNTKNRDTNTDNLPNRMLAHFFNKWENTIEVSGSSSLSSERLHYLLASFIIIYMVVSSFNTSVLPKLIRSSQSDILSPSSPHTHFRDFETENVTTTAASEDHEENNQNIYKMELLNTPHLVTK